MKMSLLGLLPTNFNKVSCHKCIQIRIILQVPRYHGPTTKSSDVVSPSVICVVYQKEGDVIDWSIGGKDILKNACSLPNIFIYSRLI